jgi:ArsR family transcriptional regulator
LDFFKALGNENRARMLKLLLRNEMHISELAKELGIAVPVALRHVRILEEAGFVERRKQGSLHVLKVRESAASKVRKAFGLFEKPLEVEVKKGETMLSALKKVSGIKIEETKKGAFISEVDGKKGFFLYEVDGKIVPEAANEYKISKNSTVELKQLLPVVGKKIKVKVDKSK